MCGDWLRQLGLLLLLVSGCATTSGPEQPTLKVSAEQRSQLEGIIATVREQSSNYLDRNNHIDKPSVAALLRRQDKRVRQILDNSQWADYDAFYRDHLTNQLTVQLNLGRSSRGPEPGAGIMPEPD